jgi:tetratricopeptide (TPR) repeat protein
MTACYDRGVRAFGGATLLVALVRIARADEPVAPSAASMECERNPLGQRCAGRFVPPARAEAGNPGGSSTELVQTVSTKRSRAKLSQFLVQPAQKALKTRAWAKAIPLYQALVVARGPSSGEAKQLAMLWTLAGQNERAAEAWATYASTLPDNAEREKAKAEAIRLAAVEDPFADKLSLVPMTAEAKKAFTLGRAAFAAKQYGDALVYFHIGHALAPELPGFLRELGSTYDKLGAPEPKREFYRRYLVQRPFGANADIVRAELAKDKDVLGTMLVSSSLPCTELWVNRQKITGKLPEKGIVVAPGNYKGLCFNPKYEMALFEYATVEPGKPAEMTFRWAIIENQLERPLGRISLENPKAPGVMIDLGITSPAVGVAAPGDGKKLKMILKDDSGVRTEERMVQIDPGQRVVVRW